MKLLFLDIDGVLNSSKSPPVFLHQGFTPVNPNHIPHLLRIVREVPDLYIVISSNWRLAPRNLQTVLHSLPEEIKVLGYTGHLPDKKRRDEILDFLNHIKQKHTIESYVILDDCLDGEILDHFVPEDPLVLTQMKDGLTFEKAQEAIDILMERK